MSQCPTIIQYICTIKQISFLRINASKGHFRVPSLSCYSFSDPQMTRVAQLCVNSILVMWFIKITGNTDSIPDKHIPKLDTLLKVLYAIETLSELFGLKVHRAKPRTLLALPQK